MIKVTLESINKQLEDDQKAFDKAIVKAQNEIGVLLTNYAKTHHKFKSRSGRLERSIKYRTSRDIVETYIDRAMAPYGPSIHEGYGKKPPDPFLEEAVKDNYKEINAILEKHINKELGL